MKPEGELLDHNYDGIQELNNPLPRWWVYLFYITIVFAVGYFTYFITGLGDSIDTKFQKNMSTLTENQDLKAIIPEEKTEDLSDYQGTISDGKTVFMSKCAACHGQTGNGIVGPNLTDNYWIHGNGSKEAIVEVVEKGVPLKGMMAWEALLSQKDILDVVEYIRSLKGSNPANAKPPQGQLIE